MQCYPLVREKNPIVARLQSDPGEGVTYVYLEYGDRWDIYKIFRGETEVMLGMDVVQLAATEPLYRVVSLECSCKGFQFRQACRHVDFIRDSG